MAFIGPPMIEIDREIMYLQGEKDNFLFLVVSVYMYV